MSDQNSFQERLKRLETKHGGFKEPPSFDPVPPKNETRSSSSGFGIKHAIMCVLGMVMVVIVGSGVFVFQSISGAPTSMVQPSPEYLERMRDDSAETFRRLARGETPNSLNGFFLEAAFRKQAGDGPMPAVFLPKGNRDWVGVNTHDARQPNALKTLETRWTQQTRKSVSALKAHPHWRSLEFYMLANKEQSLQSRASAPYGATAVFVHPEGRYLHVRMRFLHEQTVLGEHRLGPLSEKASWIDQLEKLEAKKGSSFERIKLSGIKSLNRVDKSGAPSLRTSGRSATNLDVAVPLSSRAILYLRGNATVRDLESLISTIDRKALEKTHDIAPKS